MVSKQPVKLRQEITQFPCYGRMYEETFKFCIQCIDKAACKVEWEKRGGSEFWPLGAPDRNYKPQKPQLNPRGPSD